VTPAGLLELPQASEKLGVAAHGDSKQLLQHQQISIAADMKGHCPPA
jgi:hypothetical protein